MLRCATRMSVCRWHAPAALSSVSAKALVRMAASEGWQHTAGAVWSRHLSVASKPSEGDEESEDGISDTLIFSSSTTWRFRALGAVGLFKACVWSYLGYTSYYYPEAAGHLSPWWSVVGLTMSAALMGAGQSLAANTVKEIVRTHAGSTARITTFNVFGGANAPAEVPIESLTSKDFDKGYIHLKLAGAKSFLLLDKSANIPNRSALNNLVNGRTVYMQTGRRKVAWVEARDPETGKSYWYHPVTRQTSWTKPAPS